MMRHLIPGMLEDMNSVCRSMEEAQKKDDFKTIEFLGHRIRGTSIVFGFQELSDLGKALEAASAAQDRVETRKLVQKIALHLAELDKNADKNIVPRAAGTAS